MSDRFFNPLEQAGASRRAELVESGPNGSWWRLVHDGRSYEVQASSFLTAVVLLDDWAEAGCPDGLSWVRLAWDEPDGFDGQAQRQELFDRLEGRSWEGDDQ